MAEEATTPRTVAAFDLDGTLTHRDTLIPFLNRVAGPVRLAAGLAAVGMPLAQAVLADSSTRRGDLKEQLITKVIGGRPVAELEVEAQRYAHHVLAHRLREDMLRTWEEHVRQGHELVIVSASPQLYVHPLAVLMGGAAGLGTRLVVDEGALTGRIDGMNCRGPEKVRRLDEWLVATGSADPSAVEIYAYGDSAGDEELLARATKPTRVRRR